MAMVLDALASYIQNMITEMAKEELSMLLGVPDEMEKMNIKLGDLKKFLADADRRNITEEHVQGWVKELKGAMYDATDILDLCQLKAMKQSPSRDMGCLNPLLFCLRNPLHAHDIGSRLKKLNEKLVNIENRSRTFNFINLTSCEDQGRKLESSHPVGRETTGDLETMGVVGEKIEEDTRNLVELLIRKEETIHGQNKVMVFAIVGVGGIGKTTLAKSIFNSEIIQQEFGKKIWLSVNQRFNDLDLLERAITEAGGKHQATRNTKAALVRTLKEALGGYKTLIVMDDVWDHQAWEHVLQSPLTESLAQGSRVLVTTRNDTVARGMRAEEPYHHVDKLNPQDAWSLLKKQVIRNQSDEPQVDMLKDIGMRILAKCDGLPLAVKVMGGLLRQKRTRRGDWQNVLNDFVWSSVSQIQKELNDAVYLSYQDMDPSLKPCFLHFSLLPKSTEFFVDDVVGMWIAEGLVHGSSRDLEEQGRDYYNQLILRNLIEPDMTYVDQKVCNMHDVVRSFAHYVARDEALTVHSTQTGIIDKLRSQKLFQLSLETKGSETNDFKWMTFKTQISIRTLISVGPIKIKPGDSLDKFSSIRVLHVQGANFDSLAESLVQLKHLRYLSIEDTNTTLLPEDIGKMKFLQYISLLGCERLQKLPGSIGQLPHLRTLRLNDTGRNNVPKGFSSLSNLRQLYGFPAHMDGDWCSLEELGPLSKLTNLSIDGLENVSTSSFAKKVRLLEKDRLSYLKLRCSISRDGDHGTSLKQDENISNKGQQQIEEVFDEFCPPPCLENLGIEGYFGQQLPSWMVSTTVAPLGSLRILNMEDLPYCTELPDGLCQLPCLELLQINNAPAIKSVGPEFLQPHHHEHPTVVEIFGSNVRLWVLNCSSLLRIGNLPKIQELGIFNCTRLNILEGMPALQSLLLEDYSIRTLPGYLQHVNPRHLEVDCNVSLLTSVAAGRSGPEWIKFSHIKHVKAYADDDDNKIERKWYVVYTRDPFSFKTNISRSAIVEACKEHAQRRVQLAYSETCPIVEWTVERADAYKRLPPCQRFRCNAYRHLSCWLCRVCPHCCEACRIATSTDQWAEAVLYSACTGVTLTAQQFASTGA